MTNTQMNGMRQYVQGRVLVSEGSRNAAHQSGFRTADCPESNELMLFEAETVPNLPAVELLVWLEQRVSTLRAMFEGNVARDYFHKTYPKARPAAFILWNQSLADVYQGYKKALGQVRKELGNPKPRTVDLSASGLTTDVDALLQTCKAFIEALLDEVGRDPEGEEREFLAHVGKLLKQRRRESQGQL